MGECTFLGAEWKAPGAAHTPAGPGFFWGVRGCLAGIEISI